MQAISIRPASADDWPRIWPFFARIVAEGRSYAYPDGLTLEAARPLWLEPAPSHVATASFMVDPAAQARGVGRALGEYLLAWARDAGYRAIQSTRSWRPTALRSACGRLSVSRSSGRCRRRSTTPSTGWSACT